MAMDIPLPPHRSSSRSVIDVTTENIGQRSVSSLPVHPGVHRSHFHSHLLHELQQFANRRLQIAKNTLAIARLFLSYVDDVTHCFSGVSVSLQSERVPAGGRLSTLGPFRHSKMACLARSFRKKKELGTAARIFAEVARAALRRPVGVEIEHLAGERPRAVLEL